MKAFGAILAGELITDVNILPRETDITVGSCLNEMIEAKNTGQFERKADSVHDFVVFFQNFDFPLEEQDHCFLPIHDFKRFIRGIEN
jgi:hypothetical protein